MSQDIQNVLGTEYSFDFEGTTYTVSQITQRIKGQFLGWLKPRMIAEAKSYLEGEDLVRQINAILAGMIGPSGTPAIVIALQTLPGHLRFARLVLGKQVEKMSDEKLLSLVLSPHFQAIQTILKEELSDPKVLNDLLLNQ